MGFWASYTSAFRRFGDFQGRTSRGVFWRFAAVNLGISLGLLLAGALVIAATNDVSSGYNEDEAVSPAGIIFVTVWILYAIAVFIPALAIQIRRLHDVGRSGWWVLLGLLGILGLIPLIIWWVGEAAGPNRWGPGGPGIDAPGEAKLQATPPPSDVTTSQQAASRAPGRAQVATLDEVLSRPSAAPTTVTSASTSPDQASALDTIFEAEPDDPSSRDTDEPQDGAVAETARGTDAAHQALRDMIQRRTGAG